MFSFANTIGIVDRDTNTIQSVGYQVLDAGATIVLDGVELDINQSVNGKRLFKNIVKLITINTISPNGELLILSTQEPSQKFRNSIRSRVEKVRELFDGQEATYDEFQTSAAEADLIQNTEEIEATQEDSYDPTETILTAVDCRQGESLDPTEVEEWLQAASPQLTEVIEIVAGLRRAEDLGTLMSIAKDVDVEHHLQTLIKKGFVESISGRYFLLPTPRSVVISHTTAERRQELFRSIAEGYLEGGISVPQYATNHNLIEAERAYNFAEDYKSGLMILRQFGETLSQSGYQQFRYELVRKYVEHIVNTHPEWFHDDLTPLRQINFLHTMHKCENQIDDVDLEFMKAQNHLETLVLAEVEKPIAEFYFALHDNLSDDFDSAERHLQTVMSEVDSDRDPYFLGNIYDLMMTIKSHRLQSEFDQDTKNDLREEIIYHGEEAIKHYESSGDEFDAARIKDNISTSQSRLVEASAC
ncbi:hypothetical protein RH858_12295 [Halalkaliarchaeum sp. AArc-GB]|uniref:hypothetical protein n=1 Tax=Halalkaliarchaeum sp. AArc-GB TaxID=3074078 RepID=UPI00285628D0|nr:hypothetical protein [Halalkaliarchaeum sp. AArc-GB]MDR5673924.1 hypothetical protein [Halalkaliarchaeum sp. AArc-GB]